MFPGAVRPLQHDFGGGIGRIEIDVGKQTFAAVNQERVARPGERMLMHSADDSRLVSQGAGKRSGAGADPIPRIAAESIRGRGCGQGILHPDRIAARRCDARPAQDGIHYPLDIGDVAVSILIDVSVGAGRDVNRLIGAKLDVRNAGGTIPIEIAKRRGVGGHGIGEGQTGKPNTKNQKPKRLFGLWVLIFDWGRCHSVNFHLTYIEECAPNVTAVLRIGVSN